MLSRFTKLFHLHTNLKKSNPIIKHLKSHKTIKNPHFHHYPLQKFKYRTQYRQYPQKSALSPITHLNLKPTIQSTFFRYKYENPKKNPYFHRLQTFH